MNISLAATIFLFVLSPLAHADIYWTGAVSNDVFDEANWDLSSSTVTVVDPNISIQDNVVIANTTTPAVIPDLGGQIRLQLGTGWILTIDNATLSAVNNDGVGGSATAVSGPTIRVINGGEFTPYFITNDTHLEIGLGSSATFGGGSNPINTSTVDLVPHSTLAFVNENVQAYTSEHLSKTTVFGAPAVIGGNITVVSDGGNGCIVEVISAVGTVYCNPAIPNSSGASAAISATGSPVLAHDSLTLSVSGLPPNQLGYFLCGQVPSYIPGPGGSQGALCLTNTIGRFRSQIQSSGPTGEMSIQVDLGALPVWRPHAALIGETWHFQSWFMDGATSNFSDGLTVTFQ